MTNQKSNKKSGINLNMVAQRVTARVNELQSETEQGSADRDTQACFNVREKNSKASVGKTHPLLAEDTIVKGFIWHEILSDPLCKRRRKR